MVYHERWEELALDEIKTHLGARELPIRSKTPAGVVHEIYGLMLAHYVISRVMHDAAWWPVKIRTGSHSWTRSGSCNASCPSRRRLPPRSGIRGYSAKFGEKSAGPAGIGNVLASSNERCLTGRRNGRSIASRLSR